jgi:hypothetical protein
MVRGLPVRVGSSVCSLRERSVKHDVTPWYARDDWTQSAALEHKGSLVAIPKENGVMVARTLYGGLPGASRPKLFDVRKELTALSGSCARALLPCGALGGQNRGGRGRRRGRAGGMSVELSSPRSTSSSEPFASGETAEGGT